jgi:hypothetical protein
MRKVLLTLNILIFMGCSSNTITLDTQDNPMLAYVASKDFVNTVAKYCTPKKSSVNIDNDSHFASFVEQDLNKAGYSLSDNGKKIEIYLDEIEPNLCRTSYKIDGATLSRAYKTSKEGNVKAIGVWSVNGLELSKVKTEFKKATINASTLFIRETPSLRSKKIGLLMRGETISYRQINSKWVKLKDKKAFVAIEFLKII